MKTNHQEDSKSGSVGSSAATGSNEAAPLAQVADGGQDAPGGTRRSVAATRRHSTSYLEAGPPDGPAVVLVHGWPGIAYGWQHQLRALSSLGLRVVAPDLRGCGQSSLYREYDAYAQRELVRDMVELADALHIERAVWIGHDWGAVIVSNLARHHPGRCVAAGGVSQPFNCLERGTAALLPLVNREVYPEGEFPAGQFEYMEFYHENFHLAQASFEANITTMFKAVMRRGDPAEAGKPFLTAQVRKQGGWFGPDGQSAPDLPLDTAIFDQSGLEAHVAAYTRTGFFGVNALYMNDADNRDFFDSAPQTLDLPTLYLSGTNDFVCDTEHSDLAKPMRAACPNLTYMTLPSGHWLPHERPADVSAAICRWLATKVPSFWPV